VNQLLQRPFYLTSGLWFAPLLLLLPGWTAYRIVRYRQFSLRTLLVFPAVVSLFLLGLNLPVPGDRPPLSNTEARFFIAAAVLPAIAFVAFLGRAIADSRWKRASLIATSALAVAVLIAVIGMVTDSPRAPDEHYTYSGWWSSLVVGVSYTGAVLLTAWIGTTIYRAMRATWKTAIQFALRRRLARQSQV
jgi:hypothetical protein